MQSWHSPITSHGAQKSEKATASQILNAQFVNASNFELWIKMFTLNFFARSIFIIFQFVEIFKTSFTRPRSLLRRKTVQATIISRNKRHGTRFLRWSFQSEVDFLPSLLAWLFFSLSFSAESAQKCYSFSVLFSVILLISISKQSDLNSLLWKFQLIASFWIFSMIPFLHRLQLCRNSRKF